MDIDKDMHGYSRTLMNLLQPRLQHKNVPAKQMATPVWPLRYTLRGRIRH